MGMLLIFLAVMVLLGLVAAVVAGTMMLLALYRLPSPPVAAVSPQYPAPAIRPRALPDGMRAVQALLAAQRRLAGAA